MAISRTKTWVAEILTASDLNSEFDNIIDNALSLISPLTAALDANGVEIILDVDADTSITADTDDGHQIYDTWYDSQYQDIHKVSGYLGSDERPAYRFTSVTIAQAANVTLAELTLNVVAAKANTDITVLGGIDEDNTATFSTAARPSLRSLTTSTIATGTVFGSTGDVTITVTGPVQEVIDRGSWSSGNALAIFGSNVVGDQVTIYDYSGGQTLAGRLAITVAASATSGTKKSIRPRWW